MKFKIGLKIILLGAALTLITTSITLTVSYHNYAIRAENSYIQRLDDNLKDIDLMLRSNDSTNVAFIYDLYDRVNAVYQTDLDEHTFSSWEEKYTYYKDKYPFMYDNGGGSTIGLSYKDAVFNANVENLASHLKTVTRGADGVTTFFAFYDKNRNRIIYLLDSNHDRTTSEVPDEYYVTGSYLDIISQDSINFKGESQYISAKLNNSNFRMMEIEKPVGRSDLEGVYLNCYIQYTWNVVETSKLQFLRNQLAIGLPVGIGLLLLFVILSYLLVIKNVSKLKKSVTTFTNQAINNQKLNVSNPNINSKDELEELSSSFVALENEIIKYVDRIASDAKEKEKISAELSVASKIQLEALPPRLFSDANIDIVADITSAKEVGGDFYDYFFLGQNRLAFVIADVSGKGIPAALFMMKTKELIKSRLLSDKELSDAMYEVNEILNINNEAGLFVTAFVGIYDLQNHYLEYINCGHENPFILSRDKVWRLNCNSNFVLGGIPGFKYESQIEKLQKEDLIFLNTDGLNESVNSKNEEYGYDRVVSVIKANLGKSKCEIVKAIKEDLNKFTGGLEAFDDLTMMLIQAKSGAIEIEYISPSYEIIEEVNHKMETSFESLPVSIKSSLSIVIDEILNNYITYNKKEDFKIIVKMKEENQKFILDFYNNGNEFNVLKTKDKYFKEYSSELETGGFGITLVKNLCDKLEYEFKDNLNHLHLEKKI